MQLPRGTFREIRKTVTIANLVQALEGEKYTGLATISSQSVSGTLVFNDGRFILVKFRAVRGDAALEELQKSETEVVDAALSLLDDTQVQLALEFNKPFRITKAGKQVFAPPVHRASLHTVREPARTVSRPAEPAPAARPVPGPVHTPARLHPHPASPAVAAVPPQHASSRKEAPPVPAETTDDHEGSFEEDLESFENMDLESVTDKIRNDCKSMIKQLQLDHLMER